LAKTDRIDAKVIAHFGFCHQPRPFVLQSENKRQLRQMGKVAIVACMKKLLTQLNAMIREDACWSLNKAMGNMASNAVI